LRPIPRSSATWRPHRSIADAEAALAGRLERLAKGTEYSWMLEPLAAERVVGIVSAWLASRGPCDRAVVRPNLDPQPRPSLLFEAQRSTP